MMKYIFILCITALTCFSCKEEMVMIPDFVLPASDKGILVEELTGVSCPNCPAGSAQLGAILELFEGQVVGYGIHGGFLTDPISGQSQYVFRNQDNIQLENNFSFLGKPAAVINRVKYEDENFLGVDAIGLWQGYVEREFEKPTLANIEMETSYDPASRTLNMDIDVIPVAGIDGNLYLTVTINESHIIDAQSDQGVIIPDYEHNHVLREIMTEIDGDLLGVPVIQERIPRNFTYTIPPEDGTWIAENMEIIAFVSNDVTNPGEVLQAISRKYKDW